MIIPQNIDEYIAENNPVRLIDARVKGTNPIAVAHPSYVSKEKIKLYLYSYLVSYS